MAVATTEVLAWRYFHSRVHSNSPSIEHVYRCDPNPILYVWVLISGASRVLFRNMATPARTAANCNPGRNPERARMGPQRPVTRGEDFW